MSGSVRHESSFGLPRPRATLSSPSTMSLEDDDLLDPDPEPYDIGPIDPDKTMSALRLYEFNLMGWLL